MLSLIRRRWYTLSVLSNRESILPFNKIVEELNLLNCMSLELRIFSVFSIMEIENILETFRTSILKSITLLVQYTDGFEISNLELLGKNYPRIMEINVSNSKKDKTYKVFNNSLTVNFLSRKIDSNLCCGAIRPDFFNLNMQLFTESINYNNCLNRKVSIDLNGDIKNCPSLPKVYGNILKDKLSDAINQRGFKDLWSITKDQIDVCKDCEFRYICTDCRAYTTKADNRTNIFAKPLKCDYNPYEAIWEKKEKTI